MAFNARILTVLLASPGDVMSERDAVDEEIVEWNRQHKSLPHPVRLEVLRWEHDAVPELGQGDGQQVINRQLVHDSDIVIGLFHARLGTATPRAVSGTAEELRLAATAGKPVHVYFSTKPFPYRHDRQQLQAVTEFRRLLEAEGLIDTFGKTKELRRKVARALTADVARDRPAHRTPARPQGLRPGRPLRSTPASFGFPMPTGVSLRMHFDITGPAHNEYTNRVWIENLGDIDATNVKVLLDPESKLKEDVYFIACLPQDVPAGREVRFTLRAAPQPPDRLIVRWRDPQGEHREVFDIRRINPMAI